MNSGPPARRQDPVVVAYRRSLQWRKRWRGLSEAVTDGIWLGILSQRQLRLIDEAFFAIALEPVDGADYTYADPVHIRSGLSGWERSAISSFEPGSTVVVTSAGGGREVYALTEMGFDVHGFEPNRSLVEAGRAALQDPSRLQVSPWDRFSPFSGQAAAVVIGWGSYMMIAGRDTRVSLLADARAVLKPDGLLLVSYYDRPTFRYFQVVRAVGSFIRKLRSLPPLELGDSLTPNFVHYFTPEEVKTELAMAGFDVVSIARTPYGHALARRR